MSRAADSLPPTARAIALLLASTPSVQDAQPGVLHQLLEFAHRYTSQVLTDASVYAEHAGHAGKIESDDVMLAVQARVGWEFGGRVPKEVRAPVLTWRAKLDTFTKSTYFPLQTKSMRLRFPSFQKSLAFGYHPHRNA